MWEALAAIGSIVSAVVIAVTGIFAARQVRVTVDQREQLRKSTQFEAARTVLLDLADPVFVDAYRFVVNELEAKMAETSFRQELALVGTADDTVHKEIVILRAFDRIGTYVRFGLVGGDVVYATYAPRILVSHRRLAEIVAIHRDIAGPMLYKNFDYLHDDCKRWLEASGWAFDPAEVGRKIADYRARLAAPAGGGD